MILDYTGIPLTLLIAHSSSSRCDNNNSLSIEIMFCRCLWPPSPPSPSQSCNSTLRHKTGHININIDSHGIGSHVLFNCRARNLLHHLKIIQNRGFNHVFSCHQIIGQIEGSLKTRVLTPEDTDGRKVAGNEGRRESDYESLSELNCALFSRVILPFSRLQIVTVELFLIKFEYFIAPRLLVVNLLVR